MFDRILLPTDGSEAVQPAIEQALALAETYDASLYVLHVVDAVGIPARGAKDGLFDALESEGIDFFLTDETGGRKYAALATFPLPQNAVQPVIDKLHDAGLSDEAHTVIIDAETDTSRQFEQLAKRYEAENGGDRIARDEILTEARELSPRFRTFVFMTVVSAVVATAG